MASSPAQPSSRSESSLSLPGNAPQAKEPLPVDHALGAALVLLSVALHGAANSSARYATHTLSVSVYTMSLLRGMSQAAFSATLLLTTVDRAEVFGALDARARQLVAVRGLLGGLVLYLKYAALAELPVTTAAALQCTAPFFTAVAAAAVLAEVPTPRDGVALVLTLVGAVAVARAATVQGDGAGAAGAAAVTSVRGSAIAAAVLSAVFSSAAILVVRATALRVHFVLNVLSISVATTLIPLLTLVARTGGVTAALRDMLAPLSALPALGHASLAAACGLAVCGTLCFNRGIQLLPAAKSALLRTFDIPVNYVSALVILGEMPSSMMQLVGCVFITASTYITATKEKAVPTAPASGRR